MIADNHHKPKISCLMVTANGRYDYFCRSLQCYSEQTYSNRELVIVTDCDEEYRRQISDLTSHMPDVHCVFLRGKYTLGALRNISMSLCNGDVFVQWDDDDFNMPDRLMVQYSHLLRSQNRACYLGDQLHYYFPTQELYWENWWEFLSNYHLAHGLIPGTLMAYREGFKARYPSAGKHARAGEDTVLSDVLCRENQVTLLRNKGYLQIYSFHGRNVWDLQHHLNLSKGRSTDCKFLNENKDAICRTLNHMKFSSEVKVMGRDGLAFVYREDSHAS